ncbi:MAG: hypothetical protein CMA64_07840 [Euryarchaeota archaeon]|nr:hypothetical protein [Euryarchaeota archaeon]|tara:strand:- start:372 stop:1820 length:1449 start_codon:yes stop_codon:yes gene_type:complete
MAQANIPSAGSVNIGPVTLKASPEAGGKEVDITSLVGDIVIKESIFTNYMTLDLAVGDSQNLLGKLPVIGGELITVHLNSNHLDETKESQVINQTFVIDAITDRTYKDDRESFYNIRCITPEGYKNNTTVINQRFEGPPRDIFIEIYERFIKDGKVISESGNVEGPQLNFLDMSSQTFKKDNHCFIANYWTPYRCMNYLADKVAPAPAAGKELMPNVKYFQSDKGHYLCSLSKLIAFYKEKGAIYDEFFFLPTNDESFMMDEKRTTISGYSFISPFISKKSNTMSGLEIPYYTHDIKDQVSGFQGNMTVGFDMTTRLPYHMEFDYSPNQKERRKNNKRTMELGFKDFFHIEEASTMRQFPLSEPRSALNVQIGSSQIWTDNNFGHDWRFFVDTALRDTANEELKRLEVAFNVPGRTDIDLGMLVYLNFPNTGEKDDKTTADDLFDKRLSGIYIITGIRHGISTADSNHNMRLTCVRDSVGIG